MSKSKRLEEFHRLTDELDMAKRRRGVVCEEREALARRTGSWGLLGSANRQHAIIALYVLRCKLNDSC